MRIPVNIMRFGVKGFSRRRLPPPAATNLRIAQIGTTAWFEDVRAFPPGAWAEMEAYRPQVVAACARDLRQVAEQAQIRAIDLSSVDHAAFVLTGCGDEPLTDILRVVFWQSFGVPVYELLVGPRGMLLACECEAHDGLHVEAGATVSLLDRELAFATAGRPRVRTGISGRIETERCACGREGVRVMDIESEIPARRQLAATA